MNCHTVAKVCMCWYRSIGMVEFFIRMDRPTLKPQRICVSAVANGCLLLQCYVTCFTIQFNWNGDGFNSHHSYKQGDSSLLYFIVFLESTFDNDHDMLCSSSRYESKLLRQEISKEGISFNFFFEKKNELRTCNETRMPWSVSKANTRNNKVHRWWNTLYIQRWHSIFVAILSYRCSNTMTTCIRSKNRAYLSVEKMNTLFCIQITISTKMKYRQTTSCLILKLVEFRYYDRWIAIRSPACVIKYSWIAISQELA